MVLISPPAQQRRELALALPGLVAVGGGLVLGTLDGGFPPTVWYPAALFGLALLVASVVVAPWVPPRSRLVRMGVGAYVLFVAWSFLSILWADSPGDAWLAANRAMLYGIVLVLVALRPWRIGPASAAVGLAAFGITAIAAMVLIDGVLSDSQAKLFIGGRLSEPAGYLNATANLWLIGIWPAVHLATARRSLWITRGLALAAATVLVEMELLSQSRGAAITFGVTAVLFVALTPARWPAALAIGAMVGLTALAFDPLVDVSDATRADLRPALARAAQAIAVSAAAALVLGLLAARVGRRLQPQLARRPGTRRAGDWLLVLLCAAAMVAALIVAGNPRNWLQERWDDFKSSGYDRVESGRVRFTGGLGSNRYDFYRVALDQFLEDPVLGVGGDNFADPYLQRRHTPEAPRHPHSLAFRVLSQHGVIGCVLFLTFLAGVLGAAVRTLRRNGPDEAGVAAAALAAFMAFLVHSLMDWLWAFPALGVLAFAMLGVAARVDDRPVPDEVTATAPRLVVSRAALGVVVLAAAASVAMPGIAARYTAAAYEDYATDPRLALERLDRAADLNPLSDEPVVAKGVIAQRLRRPAAAVAPLREAIHRRPGNWFSHFELGLAEAQLGRLNAAVTRLREARRLNPRQPLVTATLARLRRGGKVNPVAVERELYRALQRRLRATDPKAASRQESDRPRSRQR